MKKAWLSSVAPLRLRLSRVPALGLLATALAAAALAAGAASPRAPTRPGGSYLPTLGPAPLRILPVKPFVTPAILPPLSMKDPVAAPAAGDTNAANAGAASASAASSSLGPVPSPAGSPPSLLTEAGAAETSSGPIYTPQMLVQFFRPLGSNLVSGAWNVPVFVPPSVPASRPSSATYRSP